MFVAGVDIGSLSTAAVLMAGGRVAAYAVLLTGADSRGAAAEALDRVLASAGRRREEIGFTVATGYGRGILPFADLQVTEITCHARGALHIFPDTRTIIDVGGQDSKVIRLDDRGMVIDFAMNDKCAAGTGRFLEVMARVLEVEAGELSALAATTEKAAPVSSVCTVFAESEIVSLIAQGTARPEIARGILNSVADRVSGMAKRIGLVPPVTMTGGVAKNEGVVRALADRLGARPRIPEEPQIVGALGAALIAQAKAREKKGK